MPKTTANTPRTPPADGAAADQGALDHPEDKQNRRQPFLFRRCVLLIHGVILSVAGFCQRRKDYTTGNQACI